MTDYTHGGEIYNKEVYLDFSVNINPLGLPYKVKKVLTSSLLEFSLYPDPQCTALKKAISRKDNINSDYLICGNGASDLIFRLCMAKRPKRSLVLAPTFSEYEKALNASGSEIIYYNLKEEHGFQVEENILEHLKNIDMMFLCNPNNPVGNLINGKILRKIAEKCEKEKILLVMDECFLDFTRVEDDMINKEDVLLEQEKHTVKGNTNAEIESISLIKEILHNKNIFILRAFTKIYAMAGLRLGYGICSDRELLKNMDMAGPSWSVSVPAQLAGTIACEEMEYLKQTKTLIEEEREFLLSELKRLGIRVFEPQANYIFFKETTSLYEKLLKKGILIRQCGNYKGLTKEFYRIGVKCRRENEILVKTLEECLPL